MRGTWLVTILATVGLLLVAALRSVRRRRRARLSAMEQARRATRQIRRDTRGGRGRGDGKHFGRTKINKYGDERHSDPSSGDSSDPGGYSDSGGGSGGGSD